MLTPFRIAVCGASQPTELQAASAEAVGRELAVAGAILFCGGLGGVMEAASRGARSAAGLTVGILPTTDVNAANSYIMLPIPTGLGEGRNMVLVRCAEAVIAIGGGWGTLSEIALARQAGLLVVGLDTWAPSGGQLLAEPASSPADAVQRALAAARQRRGSAGSAVYHVAVGAQPV